MGSPASGVVDFARRASFSASSGRKVTMAFTFGLTASMRSMKARITSTAETLRERSRRASFRAPASASPLARGLGKALLDKVTHFHPNVVAHHGGIAIVHAVVDARHLHFLHER